MWIFTPFGFFSIVKKRGDKELCIRARAKEDLEALKKRYLPASGNIIYTEKADYPYRMYGSVEDVSNALFEITADIEYDNFKSEVMRTQGYKRESVYARVWSVMLDVEATRHSERIWGKDWQRKLYPEDDSGFDWGFGRTERGTVIDFPKEKPPAKERKMGRPISEGRGCVGDQGCDPCDPSCMDDAPDDVTEEMTLLEGNDEPAGMCGGDCYTCSLFDPDAGCASGLISPSMDDREDLDDRLDDTSPGIYLDRDRAEVDRFLQDAGFHRDEGKRKGRR